MQRHDDLEVRQAGIADAAAVAGLLAELGYPTGPDRAAARIMRAATDDADSCFVAVRDGRVCGMASTHRIPLFHRDGELLRITSLIVSTDSRRTGVGAALLAACEAQARKCGGERMELTSGDMRSDAHSFYEHLGFAREGVRLTKWIAGRVEAH